MNLIDLYSQTPVERHGDIRVSGDRVMARGSDGNMDEYIIFEGELWLARSDREQKQDIKAIKSKLGI